jgi:hypothetical protein
MTEMMRAGKKKKSGEGWSWEAKRTTVRYPMRSSKALLHLLHMAEGEVIEFSCHYVGDESFLGRSRRSIRHAEYLSVR